MAILGVLLTVIAVLLAVLYFIAHRQHQYWSTKGVAHDKPTPIFGNVTNVLLLKQSIYDYLHELYCKFPNEKVVGFYGFTSPFVIIRDADVIKDVLITNFSSFANRAWRIDKVGDPLGYELLPSKSDDEWRRCRQLNTPMFSSGKMKGLYTLIDKVGKDLKDLCAKTTKEGEKEVNVWNISNRFTIDAITSCGFGFEGEAVKSPEKSVMFQVLNDVMKFSIRGAIALYLLFFQNRLYIFLTRSGLGFKLFRRKLEKDIYNIVDLAIKERVQKDERRGDFLDHITFSNAPEFEGLKKKAGVSFQMLLAGSETSSTTIMFALYELARHPEAQKNLQAEIRETWKKHNGEISYETINKMEYLDQVVKETMRLWPSIPFLDRVATKDYQVPGTNIIIEKGTAIFVSSWGIQRDPNFYSDPDEFIPERFSKENAQNYHPMSFLTFGAGPRVCIGKRMGELTVKTFLVNFCKDYEVYLTDHSRGPLERSKKSFTLLLENGMRLSIAQSKLQEEIPSGR